jgi:hypothetical protein
MNEAFDSELYHANADRLPAAIVNDGDGDGGVRKPDDITGEQLRKRPPIWPLIAYIFAMSVIVAILAASIRNGPRFSLEMVMMAAMFGLAALISVLAGLWGRCWLSGFWLACLLAAAGVIGISLAVEYDYLSATDMLARLIIGFIVPSVVFAMAAPHLLMRTLCGWRLDRSDRPLQTKRSGGLLDLLALVTVLAAVSFLLRVPIVVWEEHPADYFTGIGFSAAILFTASMVLVVPSVRFAFRSRTRLRRWVLPGTIFMLGIGLAVAIIGRVDTGSWSRIEWRQVWIIAPITTAVFLVGLAMLKVAGFGLTRNVRAIEGRSVVIDDDPSLHSERLRRLHIRWAAGTLLFAILTSIVLNVQVSRRTRQDAELAQLAERFRDAGGEIVVRNRAPQKITIGSQPAAAELLAELSRYRGLTELSLAGSNVDEALLSQLPRWFPALERLDLANTNVTAQGLRNLLPLTKLSSLGLAGTDLTIGQINGFLREHNTQGRLTELDLSDSQLGAQGLARLDGRIVRLTIGSMRLTDADLELLKDRHFGSLDISGNPIAGHGLKDINIFELVAHNVPLSDDGLRSFLGGASTSVNKLVLSNTQLTDASAPLLLGVQKLHLGDGTISEAAIAAKATRIETLGLHGKQFTGALLPQLVSRINGLDLSGSGVTDQTLIDLSESLQQTSSQLYGLGLAGTEITDRGVQGLDGSFISELDLRRTGVSAAGISQMRSRYRIYVDVNQFTPQQLDMLRQHHTMLIGATPWWSTHFNSNQQR